MEWTLVLVSEAAWPSALMRRRAFRRLVPMMMPVEDWLQATNALRQAQGGALVLADVEALAALNSRSRPPPAAASPWYVVGLWDGRPVHPQLAVDLHSWGVREFTSVDAVLGIDTLGSLLTKAAFGAHGLRIRQALLREVHPRVQAQVAEVFDAVLVGLVSGERSVPSLAKRLFRSRSSLERFMRRAGLVPPSKFIQRIRLVLATQLRDDPTMGDSACRVLGFRSSGRLRQQLRRHFIVSIGDAHVLHRDPALPLPVQRLSARPRDGSANLTESAQP